MSNCSVNALHYSIKGSALLAVRRYKSHFIQRCFERRNYICLYSTPRGLRNCHSKKNNFNILPPNLEIVNRPITTIRSSIEKYSTIRFEEQVEKIPNKVRQIMRHIPQSIAILTTSTQPRLERQHTRSLENDHASVNPISDSKGVGMTLSSFSTVTLQPEPIISFNIRKPSLTLDALRYHGHFLIHFPSCSKAGALLADTFSRGGGYHQGNSNIQDEIRSSFDKSTPVSIINVRGQSISLPALLPPIYPINYVLKCEIYGQTNGYIDVADHVLIVGKVQQTWCIPKLSSCLEYSSSHIPEKNLCLAYTDGAYCFTEPISPPNND